MQTTGGATLHRALLYGCLEMSVQKKRISTCAQEEYREYVYAVAEEDKYCYFLVAWATSLVSTRNVAERISSVARRRGIVRCSQFSTYLGRCTCDLSVAS